MESGADILYRNVVEEGRVRMPLDTMDRTRVKDGIARARAAVAEGDVPAALAILRATIGAETDFLDQLRAARLTSGIDGAAHGLRPLRLAIAGATTLDHLIPPLQLWLTLAGFAPAIHLAPFDTATASILDPDSELHAFRPDLVWLFTTHRDHDLALPPRRHAGCRPRRGLPRRRRTRRAVGCIARPGLPRDGEQRAAAGG